MSNRTLAWMYISKAKVFTGRQLASALDINGQRARNLIDFFLAHQHIRRIEQGENKMMAKYRVVRNAPPPLTYVKKMRRPKLYQRLWNVCRINKRFTLYDLRSLGDAGVTNTTAYLRALVRTGLVRQYDTPDGKVYRLMIDLGPKHPVRSNAGLTCQNTGTFYPYLEGR
ncbi:hypothetical protein [Thaumasiovibrio subtropicus]|uniref:hypothetical protein n=1 Tax=Thaumasiovibrio subtropicus TaxID=1891207 RepID=UPI000B35BB89|nr:hypothetical protein [Thaumasiovibrio subtropicus]